jgi:hypothetical protein
MMTDKVTVMKHAQIKDYLLCERCEDLLNKNGERYAFEMMNTPNGFRLLDRLKIAPPMSFNVADQMVFSGDNIGLDMDKLAYFGLSVFWRAGAHTWPNKLTVAREYSIDLGAWLDPIGGFLQGSPCPSGLAIMITVAEDFLSQGYIYYPTLTSGLPLPMLSYGFLTCGIHFALFLANPIPFPYRLLCSKTAPRRPILKRNMENQTYHSAAHLMTFGRLAKNMQT